MADPITQEPAQTKPPRAPIDLDAIMGTPTPKPTGTPPADHSWLDQPISAPDANLDEPPSWFERNISHPFVEGAKAIPRGAANAVAAGANLTNAAFRLLPGIDEETPGFGRVPDRPLGTSDNAAAGLVEGIVQFGTGFVAAGPAVKAIGAGVKGAEILVGAKGGLSLTGNAAAGAAADFTAFDGHSGRLADLIAKIPGLDAPMRRYMGGTLTSEEDGEIEGRMKNALEGAGFGAAIDGVIRLARFNRVVKQARAEQKSLADAFAEAHAAVPDVQKTLAKLDDVRVADASPFKGAFVDEAIVNAQVGEQFINVDGTPVTGSANFVPLSTETFHPADTSGITGFVNRHGTLLNNPQTTIRLNNGTVEIGVSLHGDQWTPEAKRIADSIKASPGMTPQELGEAAQGLTKRRPPSPPNQLVAASVVPAASKSSGYVELRHYTGADISEPTVADANGLVWFTEGQSYLRGNKKTEAEGFGYITAHIKESDILRIDETPGVLEEYLSSPLGENGRSKNAEMAFAESKGFKAIKRGNDVAARPGSARTGPPPVVPTDAAAAALPIPAPKPPTPHQVYLGQIGFDDKTADEIGDLLHGEFIEGMTERGEVAIAFKAKGEIATDAVNPKHMSREELLSRKLREKGLNLEGLKGQPEVLAQSMRTLEKMNVALRESENPLLIKETYAQMNARAAVERDTMLGIPTTFDLSSYLKVNEKAGVEAANKIGAQARAATDLAAGIAMDVWQKAADFAKRKAANQTIERWEYVSWAESRGLAKDALDMGVNLKNALARNLYMQRGAIKPANNIARLTAVQIQNDEAALKRILMDNGGLDKIEKDAAKIAASGGRDLYQIAEVLQLSKASDGILAMTHEVRYASMLSSLTTPMAQLFGNLSVAAYLPFRRAFSAAAHMPFYARNPEALARLQGEFSEAIGTYTAMFRAIPEALRGYKTGFTVGPKLNPRGGLFDVASRAKRQQIRSEGDDALGLLVNGIGAVVSGPTRALQGGDEMARVLSFRGAANARLTRHYLEQPVEGKALGVSVAEDMDRLIYKGQALSVDQLERRALDQVSREGYTGIHAREKVSRLVAEWQDSEWYKRLSGLSDFALEQGEQAAMSRPLDPRTTSGKWNRMVNAHPMLLFVSPFTKTSVNIAKFGVQHLDFPAYGKWLLDTKLLNKPGSNYANSTNKLLADMGSGDLVRQANARGRLMLGATFSSGVAAMYMSGMVTGNGPADPKLRSQMMESGWRPYSFHIGDKYYSYRRLEPFATVIGLIADISQTVEQLPDDRLPDALDLAKGVGVAMAQNVTNKSYAQGLADFMEAITSPQEDFDKWARGIATSFAPNILRDAGNAIDDMAGMDPTLKEIRGVHDAMIAKIPWMSRDLEPRRNVLGEPIMRAEKLGPDWLSIVQVGEGSDTLKKELADLAHAFSVPSSKRGNYDMFDIKTSSGQSSYDRWLENSGTVKLGGKTLRQSLEATISSESYQRMSPESLNGEPSARATVVKTIISRFQRAAFDRTVREIPELNRVELQARMQRAASRSGTTIGAR